MQGATPQAIEGALALLQVIADPKRATAIMKEIAEAQADLEKRQAAFKRDKEAHAKEAAALAPAQAALAKAQAELVAAQTEHQAKVETWETLRQKEKAELQDLSRDLAKRESQLRASAAAVAAAAKAAERLVADANARDEALQAREALVVADEHTLAKVHAQLKAAMAG